MIVLLLVAGLVAVVLGRRGVEQRLSARLTPTAGSEQAQDSGPDGRVYFVDVEGWYRITPYETVVLTPYDLTAGTSETLAAALPARVGEWRQAGSDEYVADDPAVVYYLKHPTVALQRTYQDAAGQELTLVLLGNKGDDSFLLFSHTPQTCYPGQLWEVVETRRESALLDDRPMYAQYLLAEHAGSGEQLLVLYWYLWQDAQRDSRDGVLSIRVNVRLRPGQSADEGLDRAWNFVRALFPATIAWERF